MYKEFYNMSIEPFGTLPVPDVFFDSKTHKEAWYYLLYGIESQEPFLIVIGDFGMGKTMLCLKLVQKLQFSGEIPYAYIATPNCSYTHILREIASSLDIPTHNEEDSVIQSLIYQYFKTHTFDKGFYVIVDDVQDLDISTLKKLQLFVNFNHNGFFPIRLILFGHSPFLDKLKSPTLGALGQRIKRRYHLSAFDIYETKEYIYFRLLKAEAPGIPSFTDDAIQKIFVCSSGVPRLINNICDSCLLLGASQGLTEIDERIVSDAAKAFGEKMIDEKPEGQQHISAAGFIPDVLHIPLTYKEDQSSTADKGYLPVGKTIIPITGLRLNILLIIAIIILLGALVINLIWQDGIINSFKSTLYDIAAVREAPKASSDEQGEKERHYDRSETTSDKTKESDTQVGNEIEKQNVQLNKTSSALSETRQDAIVKKSKTVNSDKPDLSLKSDTKKSTIEEIPQVDLPSETPDTVSSGKNDLLGTLKRDSSDVRNKVKEEIISADSEGTAVRHPYSIQVCSYPSQEKAKKALEQLKRAGLSPYLNKVDLGDKDVWWRVYEGYYNTQEDAVKIKKKHKLANATIIKTPYANLIGVFSSETEMGDIIKQLEDNGYHYPYSIKNENDSLKLFVGAFSTMKEAEQQNLSLQSDGIKCKVEER